MGIMDRTERMYRQVGLWIAVWFVITGVVLAGIGYWQMRYIQQGLHMYQETVSGPPSAGHISLLLKTAFQNAGLAAGALLVVTGFLHWFTLRSAIRKEMPHDSDAPPLSSVRVKEDGDRETRTRLEERRAIHLLALLQREGRLVDFLQEDLRAYDDAQIGAAVRGIQESCRESLNKYIGPRPVIDKAEGEAITIDEGFDANRIRLTGNVSGRPPFKGILQHRGWQSSGLNLPTLSGAQDPAIIAPAEVEIP
jgi:hypothetical protein